jgi:hypothetical protein
MDNYSENLKYFESSLLTELQNLFQSQLKVNELDAEKSSVREIREFMFKFFDSTEFVSLYFKIAREILSCIDIPKVHAVLQMLPTPRVFRPRTIGTSYHCDYWYGHGAKSYTVWVPLTNVDEGNTFRVVPSEQALQFVNDLENNKLYEEVPKKILDEAIPVMPSKGQAYVFNSKQLHGSPLNSSFKTRLSLDFRISNSVDPTSTKDLAHYYHFVDEEFKMPKHDLDGLRVLKYICGGVGKDTFVQHIIIESTAKRFNMNVYEQEAEIERFGYPIFSTYVDKKMKLSNLEAMIIASKHVLDEYAINHAKEAGVKIWCSLENDYLHNL